MPYLVSGTRGNSDLSGYGCGGSCSCDSCRSRRLGEIYESDRMDGYGEVPAAVSRACPVPPGTTTRDRCRTEHPCPPIPNLLCVQSVDGVTFHGFRTQSGGGVVSVRSTGPARQERFTATLLPRLQTFIGLARGFGMSPDQILSMGSLNCRCISNTDRLSDHSLGEALDISGFRWTSPVPAGSVGVHALIHNFRNPAHIGLIRRINAALRLAFPRVLDYHLSDHRDHFHVDNNRGRGFTTAERTTIRFTQEALLEVVGDRSVTVTGHLNAVTAGALQNFARLPASTHFGRDRALLVMLNASCCLFRNPCQLTASTTVEDRCPLAQSRASAR